MAGSDACDLSYQGLPLMELPPELNCNSDALEKTPAGPLPPPSGGHCSAHPNYPIAFISILHDTLLYSLFK